MEPDRDLSLEKLERRALQLGISGSVVYEYVNKWIMGIEDVTELAYRIKASLKNRDKEMLKVPDELVYEVNPVIQKTLGIE